MKNQFSRRRFSSAICGSTMALFAARCGSVGWAADGVQTLNRFPRVMQEFLVDQVAGANQQSSLAKAKLETRQQAQEYVRLVREKIALCFGPLPEKTDLQSRTTGVVERDGYRIENIIFESRPNFPVTANLYLPKAVGTVPAVVGTCGHSSNGKAAGTYQAFAQGLARLGYACLIFDPIGQGERLQYVDEHLKSKYGAGVKEHIHGGNQQFLVGEFFGTWRAWDGIRALDYLLTRPEVNPLHIGITGNSGGGTMTTWLCGLEDRFTMAAPGCFVTTFLHNAENELPADTEQCPPHALALGLEHEDFLAAMAPKPIVILAKERDFFDVRGGQEAFARLQKLYQLLGKPENISLQIGPTEHGFSIENRQAMYAWFNQITGLESQDVESKIVIERDETLWCTRAGQVAELKPATLFTFTREKAQQLKHNRGAHRPSNPPADQLLASVSRVLNLPPELPIAPPEFRILRDFGDRGYPRRFATTYAVETEADVFAISYMLGNVHHLSRPPNAKTQRSGSQALLYVAHRSSDDELRTEDFIRQPIESSPDVPVFTCDVRGIGESLPNTCGQNSFDNPYGCDYFYAIHGIMLDRSYLGQKTLDVLRVMQWLKSFGYDRIELLGNDWGALPATFAALLSASLLGPCVEKVGLHKPLPSFHALAADEAYHMPLAYLPLDVLSHFDLPDCYAALKAMGLLSPTDP